MQRLMVFGHNVEVTKELTAYIESHVDSALRPFGKRIGVVCVRLHQASDPHAQVSCYIRVDLIPSGGLALGEFAPAARQAIAVTTRRIAAAVGREIKRASAGDSTGRSHAFLA
jgi:hypothetical protein